jgi:hypothetical protein
MTGAASHRHERAVAVEHASYRWAYFAMSFGVLGLVAYRSLLWREASWDLLLLVVLGGTVPAAYQAYPSRGDEQIGGQDPRGRCCRRHGRSGACLDQLTLSGERLGHCRCVPARVEVINSDGARQRRNAVSS